MHQFLPGASCSVRWHHWEESGSLWLDTHPLDTYTYGCCCFPLWANLTVLNRITESIRLGKMSEVIEPTLWLNTTVPTTPWHLLPFTVCPLTPPGTGTPPPLQAVCSSGWNPFMEKQSPCGTQCGSMYLRPRIPALAGIAQANATLEFHVSHFIGTSALKSVSWGLSSPSYAVTLRVLPNPHSANIYVFTCFQGKK